MMSREEIKLQLQDYLENLLNDEETKNIESHLASCSKCQKELSELKELVYSIESLPKLEPPGDITQLIMARITNEPVPVSLRTILRNWLPKLGFAYLVGLGLVISTFFGVKWVYQTYFSSQYDPIDLLTKSIVTLSSGIGKLAQWFDELWMVGSSLLQHNLSTITSMFIIEVVILIAGIIYWFIRKQKSTHFIFA